MTKHARHLGERALADLGRVVVDAMNAFRAFVNEATEDLESLERQYQFLKRKEEAAPPSRASTTKALACRRAGQISAFGRFKAAASTAGAALAIATALRYFPAARERSAVPTIA